MRVVCYQFGFEDFFRQAAGFFTKSGNLSFAACVKTHHKFLASYTRVMTRRILALGNLKNFYPHLILCSLLAVGAAACKSDYPASARQNINEGKQDARQVKVARVEQVPFGQTVTATGTLAAYDQATVSVKVPGRLKTINVDLGTRVARGQLIAQIDPSDYQLKVEQARAALVQARVRLGLPPEGANNRVDPERTATVRQARAVMEQARADRQRALNLVEQGVVSRAEFDAADANYKVAVGKYEDALEEIRNRQGVLAQRKSELEIAQQQLIDTNIYAPFDGVVQQKRASVGEYLAASAPVADIVKMNPLRLRAEVPERAAGNVRTGQTVRVTVEGGAHSYVGVVRRLSPTISEQSRVLVVEADVTNDGTLRPGAFAQAEIVTSNADMAVAVPSKAVVTFAGIEKVIVVQNGKALEKTVTTGRRVGDMTEIVSGVNVGDTVVLDPGNLQSGQPVVTSDE
jgi:RND family efflux transporter MFP subunit